MSESKILQYALRYAQKGWFVFPCAPHSKKPFERSNGLNDGTIDPDVIRAWFRADPNANIGVNCGKSNLVVPDIDPRHGGDDTWHELCMKHSEIETLACVTPGGGQHFYFEAGDYRIASGANVLGPGIDIRAQGGYVVAPPSRLAHGAYVWEVEHGPHEIAPQPLPAWIADVIAATRPGRVVGSTLPKKLLPGQRRDRLFRLGTMVRDRGANEQEIAALLHAINQGRCQPPLPSCEVSALACDIARRYTSTRNIFQG